MKEIAIQLRDVEFSFLIQKYGVGSLKEYILKFGKGNHFEHKTVLSDINLDILRGETFGVVGRNGSGKSTLLRLIAGVLSPDRGTIRVDGKIAPLLALGVGLQPELSGLENIRLCGTLMGLSRHEIDASKDSIIEFSELSDAITIQVKRYSSGMLSRLAFAIATAVQPEILILDEILSVGDMGFQKKCAKWMEGIRQQGCTILYVSHSPNQVRKICTRAACLENGTISMVDTPEAVSDYYHSTF